MTDAPFVNPNPPDPDVLTPEEEAAYTALSNRIHAGERRKEHAEMLLWVLDNLPEGYHVENDRLVRDDPSLPLAPYLGEFGPGEWDDR